ncbi:CheY-like chemotaxis protein [Endobacter medicaginis]|uniref:CheY-like chemotaxis protein n=1 Tax=Endobacter medicaginis TaxID=1181271 RepID=A0A839UWK2_9PROT|nr:response regulator [Endobacter medicaginis]MBB3174197.1 CheY-like chemotaxis protein [Endobacter medicaginis]MCX5474242.1 response regulator [Endobacter medicaginis]NVN30687.1 response regulator [Endobacter medicaginis]
MPETRRNDLIRALPYARRYARAVTGSQQRGDLLVSDSLRAMNEAENDPYGSLPARFALYGWITARFNTGGLGAASLGTDAASGGLSQRQRQLLLLTSLEDVPLEAAAIITGLAEDDAANELDDARAQLRDAAATDVLIIEDEPIIAMDLEELVQSCGHRVVGVADSEKEAVRQADESKPGLILADINLGIGGDGTTAVSRILETHYAPVIFVTAYPERLLTGDAVEPAFVITKPFDPMTLAIATYQAVTGGVTLT